MTTYPSVALVDSGPWSLGAILPALRALGVPAVYRQTYDYADYPAAPPNLANSVSVLPNVAGSCAAPSATRAAVMARTTARTLDLTTGGHRSSLQLLSVSSWCSGLGAPRTARPHRGQTPR